MNHTATYSPEDNKLRVYPARRLDAEEYAAVKAAGFAWAPKQGLFVAPSWSPAREDFLIGLCGEIGDEDTSLVDRAEIRAERWEGISERHAEGAESAHAAVSKLADSIPARWELFGTGNERQRSAFGVRELNARSTRRRVPHRSRLHCGVLGTHRLTWEGMAMKTDGVPLIHRASLEVHAEICRDGVSWKTSYGKGKRSNEYSCGCVLTTYFPQHDAPHRAKGFEFIACMKHDGR